MTTRKVWLGSVGPFLYEDNMDVGDSDLPAGTDFHAVSTTGQIFVNIAPVLPQEVLRKVDMPVFTGVIVMWSGSIASIPSGWLLCDGTAGTPDLRDRFVVGAGTTYTPGDIGGADSLSLAHTHSDGSLATDSQGAHIHSADGTLTTASEAAHTHGDGSYTTDAVTAGTPSGTNSAPIFTGDAVAAATTNATPDLVAADISGAGVSPVTTATGTVTAPVFTGSTLGTHSHDVTGTSGTGSSHVHDVTGDTSSNGAHTHDVTGATGSSLSSSTDIRPKYYSLAFIMKS